MPVRFAHISDSHIGPSRDFQLYESSPASHLERLVAQLNRFAHELDFVIHTGDVVSDPQPESFQLAAEILAALKLPLYLVNGNHDDAAGLRQAFTWPPLRAMAHETAGYSYTFCCRGERFLALDAVGPQQIDPQGWLGDAQLQTLDRHLAKSGERLTVLIHFPAIPLDCRWIDSQMLIMNGRELHRRLVAQRERLRGVFFGHVHRAVQATRDGVFYSSAPSTFCQFRNWPSDEAMVPESAKATFFNLVTLDPEQVTVQQKWV